ncbi:MAG: hydroxyacylglutathione hydrolase [Actinomycetota bacterium]|nr:hydroxyacylglutathione hydrolase [Actinomycetota bacterium]
MLVTGFPAGPFGTNCFVVADGPGSECLVIDPGMNAMPGIEALLSEHNLQPAAVILTHGHLDHTWSVLPVCASAKVPAYIHADDRAMLADPYLGMGPDMQAMLAQMTAGRMEFAEPEEVRALADGDTIEIVGVELGVGHAPGHTPGSIVFTHPGTGDLPPLLFSGDLLFAGSIGRTDLPGGDPEVMTRSLARVLPPLADETAVLPGHGPQTSMAAERATNPYLKGLG